MLMFSVKIDERTRKEWIKRKEREFKRRAGGFLLSPHDHRPFSFSLCFFLAILCRSFLTILIWCVCCPFTFAYSTACWNYAEKILLQLSRLQRLARKTSDTQNLLCILRCYCCKSGASGAQLILWKYTVKSRKSDKRVCSREQPKNNTQKKFSPELLGCWLMVASWLQRDLVEQLHAEPGCKLHNEIAAITQPERESKVNYDFCSSFLYPLKGNGKGKLQMKNLQFSCATGRHSTFVFRSALELEWSV